MQLVERHRAKQKLLAENTRKTADIEKRNEEVFEEIGRAAFAAYKNFPDRQGMYGNIFARLEELEGDLQSGRVKIESYEIQIRDGALLTKIRNQGRIAYLKSILALKKRAQAGSFRKTGSEICESEFIDKIQDENFIQAIWPYTENKEQIASLQEQKAKLEEQQEQIWAELKSLGAEKGHEKKVRELEKIIAETEGRLKDSCLSLGLLYRKSPAPALSADEEISVFLQDVARVEKMMSRDKKQIKRLEADLEAEEISREMEKTREQIQRLNAEIAGGRQQLAELEQLMRDKEDEREKLLKRRGPESTLLAIEAPKQQEKDNG